MADQQDNETRGTQQETTAEREAKKNPANDQDIEKPAEGRDEPPADAIKQGKRDAKSPWLGGG